MHGLDTIGHPTPVNSFKIPEHWLQVEGFPLTGSGKVQKFRLRERFGTGKAG